MTAEEFHRLPSSSSSIAQHSFLKRARYSHDQLMSIDIEKSFFTAFSPRLPPQRDPGALLQSDDKKLEFNYLVRLRRSSGMRCVKSIIKRARREKR